jgi:hypothetical protein
LFQLGKVYYHLGYNRLAEHTLKIAVRVDPVSEDLWSLLGLVTEALAHEYVTQGKFDDYKSIFTKHSYRLYGPPLYGKKLAEITEA